MTKEYKMNVLPGEMDINGNIREAESFEDTHDKVLRKFLSDTAGLRIPVYSPTTLLGSPYMMDYKPYMTNIVGYIIGFDKTTYTYTVEFLKNIQEYSDDYKIACAIRASCSNNESCMYETKDIILFHFIESTNNKGIEKLVTEVKEKGEKI